MKQKKKTNNGVVRCPYCGSVAIYRSSKGIYPDRFKEVPLFVCSNYPECDSYVRAQENSRKPLGTMANRKLRSLRIEAHRYFNQLYETGMMTKDEAYQELKYITLSGEGHIAAMSEYGCQEVIDHCKSILKI